MPFVIFAAPYFTENAHRFLSATLKVADTHVGVISQEPWERLSDPLRERTVGHWRVDDALDARQLAQAAQALSRQHGPVHRLLGVVEQIQVPLAEARQQLGVPGMRVPQARNFRDKARMKTLLRQAGLPCARHRLVASEAEATAFTEEVGYPVVAKPPAGAAAQSTYRVQDADALASTVRASAPSPDNPMLLEELVTGDEHSFDAFCVDGRVVFHSIARYFPTPLEVLEHPWIQWCVILPREIEDPQYDDIRDAGARALDVLGMDSGMCHLEWFRRPNRSLAISEVAARPPGAQFTTLISRGSDFDADYAWARLMIQGEFDLPERRYAVGAAYLRGQARGRIHAVHGLDQVEREVGALVVDAKVPHVGQETSGSYEGEGYVIVRHPETAVVQDAVQRVVSLVRLEVQ